MKVFVTGVDGQLGHDVVFDLQKRGIQAVGSDLAPDCASIPELDYEPLDITNAAAVQEVLKRVHPDAVIHCAAWTAVDAAEEPANQAKVHAVNAEGTAHIAQACAQTGCKLMYLSTD